MDRLRQQRFNYTLHPAAIVGLWIVCNLAAQLPSTCIGQEAEYEKHPLSESQVGDLLIGELRCGACHSGLEQPRWMVKSAPDLADVGSRVAPDYLAKYIASPSQVHSGTTMPDVLESIPVSQRSDVAKALTHFLISQSQSNFNDSTGPSIPDAANSGEGRALFQSVGCVACHVPLELKPEEVAQEPAAETAEDDEEAEIDVELTRRNNAPLPESPKNFPARAGGMTLGHVALKYSQQSLSQFLFQPLAVRHSGRMPDMKLTPSESQAIAGYLMASSGNHQPTQHREALLANDDLADLGKKYFQEFNCAACHALPELRPAALVKSLSQADLSRGCLSNQTNHTDQSRPSPKFQLKPSHVTAIVASLHQPHSADSENILVAKTLTVFNCIACHIRDDFGGVIEDRNAYFETTEKNLGEDGRIPPPLTLVGAKLRPAWLKKVLFDGESIRHYMTTRMPQYGEPNLRHLPDLFSQLDVIKSVEMNIPSPESDSDSERERERTLRTAGRTLLGSQGVYCISCHNFNGKPSPLNKGIDLMTSYQRLQPGWFNNFLRNPGGYRPRIVMPYSWPDGEAVHKTILDGNTDMQIEAIWYYLSLGTSAADPEGIRRVDKKLQVVDKPRTYRGRSSIAGFRGIAVGFPEKISYAFNAETGTLTSIWLGEFIHVDRGGQGSGGFNPSGRAIAFAQDVSFLAEMDDTTPWPLRPTMTKEVPVNQNPLYPKNVGYQFRGYFMDEASVPTFRYASGDIEIEDRSEPMQSADRIGLERTLQFDSRLQRTLWFRALTGRIEQDSDMVYKTDKIRLQVPQTDVVLRPLSDNPDSTELILKLDIPQGKSTLSFTYEPIEK